MPVVIPRGERRGEPGTWWPVVDARAERRTASIFCPECKRGAHLNHDIAADGTVTPSVVCPHPGCTWHVMVKLAGWPA